MDQATKIIRIEDVIALLPTYAYDSTEEYLTDFRASYGKVDDLDEATLDLLRSQCDLLTHEGLLDLTINCKGFVIEHGEILKMITKCRKSSSFNTLDGYCAGFKIAVDRLIKIKIAKQKKGKKEDITYERKHTIRKVDQSDGKDKGGCFICRFKKWVKKILSRKG